MERPCDSWWYEAPSLGNVRAWKKANPSRHLQLTGRVLWVPQAAVRGFLARYALREGIEAMEGLEGMEGMEGMEGGLSPLHGSEGEGAGLLHSPAVSPLRADAAPAPVDGEEEEVAAPVEEPHIVGEAAERPGGE